MSIYLSLLICLIGLIVFCVSDKPKVSTLSLHLFWVGLLAFLLQYGKVYHF